jgi:hypothetical protein
MINYNFDIYKLLQQYLPIALRKTKILQFLYALFAPIVTLKDLFLAFITRARREVIQNGQVIRLENLLNDLFDSDLRRIRITDTSGAYFILSDENLTIISDSNPVFISDEVDFNFSVDFVVKVIGGGQSDWLILSDTNYTIIGDNASLIISNPNSNPLFNQVENVVKRYKIAGKTFQIDVL